MSERLLTVKDLKVYFPVKKGLMSRTIGQGKAVDGISFHVEHGETLGMGGGSGCGKATAGARHLGADPRRPAAARRPGARRADALGGERRVAGPFRRPAHRRPTAG